VRDPKKPIPIWWQKNNENTQRDLNRFAVELMADNLTKALQQEHPAGLLEIKTKIGALEIGFNIIHNATKKDPKHRAELTELYEAVRADIKALAESTGFDLLDESTWNQ
jgi:hypothetical protein